jgi:hypothetical protein
VAVHPCPGCTPKVPLPIVICLPSLLAFFLFFQHAGVSAFVSATIMAPQLDAAQHILIETLLKEGFKTKLIASKASCSVRAVQRIRRKRQQFEMPTLRTNRLSRRSCITSPMQKALCDILIKQPYLYRCEIAGFLYCRFRKRISERSIGWTLRLIGWSRTTIHHIAQQWDADL